jgi:hypothetical protein
VTQGEAINDQHLFCNHEEADTRLLFHAADAAQTHPRIVVWSPDTDVAVLCISYCSRQHAATEVWFRTGVKDRTRFVPFHTISSLMTPDLCALLPAVHAVSGCDSTSSLAQLGKITALKTAKSNICRLSKLANLGDSPDISDEVFEAVQLFVCLMYDSKAEIADVDSLRYTLFCRKQARNQTLPPTRDSLYQHAMRANYQALIWKLAFEGNAILPSPVNHGWHHDNDGTLQPTLTTRLPAPKVVLELITCGCKKGKCQRNCSCQKQKMACTDSCYCQGGEECLNPSKPQDDDSDDDSDSDVSDG